MDDIISKNIHNPLIFLRKWLLIHVLAGLRSASCKQTCIRIADFCPDIIISQVYKGVQRGGSATYYLSVFLLSSSVIWRITLQGFPTATLFDGMFFVTILPLPITTLLPMVTPGITCTPAPIHTFVSHYNWIRIFKPWISSFKVNGMS